MSLCGWFQTKKRLFPDMKALYFLISNLTVEMIAETLSTAIQLRIAVSTRNRSERAATLIPNAWR